MGNKWKKFYPHADVFFDIFQVVDHRLLLIAFDQMLCIQAINLFESHLTEATMSSTSTISEEWMQSINTPELSPEINIFKSTLTASASQSGKFLFIKWRICRYHELCYQRNQYRFPPYSSTYFSLQDCCILSASDKKHQLQEMHAEATTGSSPFKNELLIIHVIRFPLIGKDISYRPDSNCIYPSLSTISIYCRGNNYFLHTAVKKL